MNFHTLQYVVTAAKEQSFTRAAEKLFVSQPSLSQSILQLEKELGAPLFDRKKSPVKLTLAGEAYFAWATQVLDSQEQTSKKIADIAGESRLRLSVGISPHRSAYLLPEVLRTFFAEWPECSVNLEERPVVELSSLLDDGGIDIMIDQSPENEVQHVIVPLMQERTLLAVPESYDVRGVGKDGDYPVFQSISMKNVPFLSLKRGPHPQATILRLCAQLGFEPDVRLECRNVETTHLMVSMGLGVAFLPELMVRYSPPLAGVNYFLIGDPPLTGSLSVVYRADRYLPRAAHRFIELLQEFGTDSSRMDSAGYPILKQR